MKRRGFLWFMGGAAVAGPAVAKNAVATMPKGLVDAGPMFESYSARGISGGGDWKVKEIASLKRFLTGDLTDDEKEDRRRQRLYSRQTRIGHDIAALVSVSGAHKLVMFESRMEAHQDEIRRSDARSRLSRLLMPD